jgi:uncharacterized protein YpuA (DUF1002 family)
MNNLPIELDLLIYDYLPITSLYDLSITNKDNYNKCKIKLKKDKIKTKIMNLNVCENTKNKLIENMNKKINLDYYENHINKIKNLKLVRYLDG